MFNKENIDANSFTKISFIRSPLKEFPLNTFNFFFSSRKKDSNVKKLEFSIKKTVKKITPKKALNIDISDNDLLNIFEALNKTIQKNNIKQKNELKEYNENESLNNNILLNKKRKRKFKTIKAYNNQKKFIKYKISKNETKDSIKNNKIKNKNKEKSKKNVFKTINILHDNKKFMKNNKNEKNIRLSLGCHLLNNVRNINMNNIQKYNNNKIFTNNYLNNKNKKSFNEENKKEKGKSTNTDNCHL